MNQHFVNGIGQTYKSTFDCFRQTVMMEGYMALYKGWFPNWLRLGPHTVYFQNVQSYLIRFYCWFFLIAFFFPAVNPFIYFSQNCNPS